jgi:transglutaminase-like putative cysteine protease
MWIDVDHTLKFHYDRFVRESRMELRTEPLTSERQMVHSFVLAVGPSARVHRYRDWNGNWVHHFGIADYHDRIEVRARSLVNTQPPQVGWDAVDEPAPSGAPLGPQLDFVRFDGPANRSRQLEEFAAGVPCDASAPLAEQVAAVGANVRDRLRYEVDATDWRSSTEDFLARGAGVCQDFAHLMLALLRLRGIPCRYAGGYLHEEGRDAAQGHAWVEVFTRAHGWLGFDPTHRCATDERYVTVATGRHYDDVAPNRGIYRGSAVERLESQVVTRIAERRDVVGLHEEIASIDVPVFRQLPGIPGESAPDAPRTEQQQQQQQ